MQTIALSHASSVIGELGYDPDTEVLEVRLRNGMIYPYNGVPSDVVEEFSQAESPGRFWNQVVKSTYGRV